MIELKFQVKNRHNCIALKFQFLESAFDATKIGSQLRCRFLANRRVTRLHSTREIRVSLACFEWKRLRWSFVGVCSPFTIVNFIWSLHRLDISDDFRFFISKHKNVKNYELWFKMIDSRIKINFDLFMKNESIRTCNIMLLIINCKIFIINYVHIYKYAQHVIVIVEIQMYAGKW